jgi:predicted kinase
MQGLAEVAASASDVDRGLYARSVTRDLYTRLGSHAEAMLRAGHSVILDASFLARATRDDAREVARRSGAQFVLCDVVADEAVLRQRIAARQARGDDPSEADARVLAHQVATQDPLLQDEQDHIVRCHSDDEMTALTQRLTAQLQAQN